MGVVNSSIQSERVVVVGGLVVDGSGEPPYVGDVLIEGDRISSVRRSAGEAAPADADLVIDAAGHVVCPGFVDIHTHSDLTLLSSPGGGSKLLQGVTTEVVGNCGLGMAPTLPRSDLVAVRESVAYIDLDPEVRTDWHTIGGYLAAVEAKRPAINVGTFAAHLPIRASVLGYDDVAPDDRELRTMQDLVGQALDEGAVGLSTGLNYAPLCFAPPEELLGLGAVVAERDRLFAWHLRDYADDLLPALDVALQVAERTGCRTQISHLVSVGQRNWGSVERALERIDSLRDRGVDVGVDVYPYLAGNAPLSQVLPAWAQAGGVDAMRQLLADPQSRALIRSEWSGSPGRPLSWDEIVPVWLPAERPDWSELVGRTIEGSAAALGVDPDELALDLMQEFGAAILIVAYGRSRGDLEAVLAHGAAVVASDGQALAQAGPTGVGMPHPRSYGTYPRYLSEFAPDLATGVRKCTALAAERVGVTDRGKLTAGAPADVVVFNASTLSDRATFENPRQHPAGIRDVLVAGSLAVRDGVATGSSSGVVLRAG